MEKAKDYDHLFKLVVIGETGIGKTSFINRYVTNWFDFNLLNTIGVDFMMKNVETDLGIVKV